MKLKYSLNYHDLNSRKISTLINIFISNNSRIKELLIRIKIIKSMDLSFILDDND